MILYVFILYLCAFAEISICIIKYNYINLPLVYQNVGMMLAIDMDLITVKLNLHVCNTKVNILTL